MKELNYKPEVIQVIIGVVLIVISGIVIGIAFETKKVAPTLKKTIKASPIKEIPSYMLSPLSDISEDTKAIIRADVVGRVGLIKGSSIFGIIDSLEKTEVPDDSENERFDVLGETSENGTILPSNFSENASLARIVEDENKFSHYFFVQQLPFMGNRIPVFGSYARFDIDSKGRLFGASVTLTRNTKIESGNISLEEAKAEAIKHAFIENQKSGDFLICPFEPIYKIIINKSLISDSSDTKNYLSYVVPICNKNGESSFNKVYYVSTKTGEILFSESKIYEALNRNIKDCGKGSCVNARKEGDGPTGIKDVDSSYDIFGEVYQFYKDNFDRDSFDNKGAQLVVRVNNNRDPIMDCPNAAYDFRENLFKACSGVISDDIWAHEFTHGVTMHTASLIYQNQPGALNESFSDIFGWGVDQEDWTMGEDSVLGSLRRLDDPTKSRRSQPDRLFSPRYFCAGTDNGGVHINNGVLNKGFYLMVEGGTFNGCTISGIGAEKALKIAYKALTVYLQPTANFKSAYNAFLRACSDLYGQNSGECQTTAASLQAVEMDQQTSSTTSPICQNKKGAPPTCAGSSNPTAAPTTAPQSTPGPAETPIPKDTPSPTKISSPASSVTLSPTQPSTQEGVLKSIQFTNPCFSNTPTTAINNYKKCTYTCSDGRTGDVGDGTKCYSKEELTELAQKACLESTESPKSPQDIPTKSPLETPTKTPVVTLSLTVAPNNTPTSIVTQNPSLTVAPTEKPTEEPPEPTEEPDSPEGDENIILSMALRFQGIRKKPSPPYDTMVVRIGLVSEDLEEPLFQNVLFKSEQNGIWYGTAYFEAKLGKYYILVKGPMHIQRKICHNFPTERYEGTYSCGHSRIDIEEGDNELDFSNIYLLAGDLPDQDGVVNGYDLALIRNNFGSSNPNILPICDVNKDRVCNSQDYALVISSLSIKLDEE